MPSSPNTYCFTNIIIDDSRLVKVVYNTTSNNLGLINKRLNYKTPRDKKGVQNQPLNKEGANSKVLNKTPKNQNKGGNKDFNKTL